MTQLKMLRAQKWIFARNVVRLFRSLLIWSSICKVIHSRYVLLLHIFFFFFCFAGLGLLVIFSDLLSMDAFNTNDFADWDILRNIVELCEGVTHWIPNKELQNARGRYISLTGLVSGRGTSWEAPSSEPQSRLIIFVVWDSSQFPSSQDTKRELLHFSPLA